MTTQDPTPPTAPVLLWLRRELRLHDNAALVAAVASGRPVLPVFVLDDESAAAWSIGGAARWWMHHSLAALATDLAACGAPLILRRGPVVAVLAKLVQETDAVALHAGQPVEGWARDAAAALQRRLSIPVHLHRTITLYDPDAIRTGGGTPYGVFTPFARACRAQGRPAAPLPAPKTITAPASLPASDGLESWDLLPERPDWAAGLRAHLAAGRGACSCPARPLRPRRCGDLR